MFMVVPSVILADQALSGRCWSRTRSAALPDLVHQVLGMLGLVFAPDKQVIAEAMLSRPRQTIPSACAKNA
jgi:hypothetical protein